MLNQYHKYLTLVDDNRTKKLENLGKTERPFPMGYFYINGYH